MEHKKGTGNENKNFKVYKMEGKFYEIIRSFRYFSKYKHLEPKNNPLHSITIRYPRGSSITVDGKESEILDLTDDMKIAS